MANVIKRCMELPGQNLFQYLDEDGVRHAVTSSDINAYLQSLTGSDFTAKDYRTWAASALALATLQKLHWEPEADAKRHIVDMVKAVSKQLGNTLPSAENATSTPQYWKASCSATWPNSLAPGNAKACAWRKWPWRATCDYWLTRSRL